MWLDAHLTIINTGRNAGWCLQLEPRAGLRIAVCWAGASHRALEDIPSAGKMSDTCPWWRKEDEYSAKLQTFNLGRFCTGHGELTSTFTRFSSILMDVVGSSAGGDFKYSTCFFWLPMPNMHVRSKKCTFIKSRREMMGHDRLCEFVLPEFAPKKVLFHTERHIES